VAQIGPSLPHAGAKVIQRACGIRIGRGRNRHGVPRVGASVRNCNAGLPMLRGGHLGGGHEGKSRVVWQGTMVRKEPRRRMLPQTAESRRRLPEMRSLSRSIGKLNGPGGTRGRRRQRAVCDVHRKLEGLGGAVVVIGDFPNGFGRAALDGQLHDRTPPTQAGVDPAPLAQRPPPSQHRAKFRHRSKRD